MEKDKQKALIENFFNALFKLNPWQKLILDGYDDVKDYILYGNAIIKVEKPSNNDCKSIVIYKKE